MPQPVGLACQSAPLTNPRPCLLRVPSLLGFRHKLLEDDSDDERPGPLERLQAAIVENVKLYVPQIYKILS